MTRADVASLLLTVTTLAATGAALYVAWFDQF